MKKMIVIFLLLSVFSGSAAAQVVINYRRPGSAYVFGSATLSGAKADKTRFPGSWGPMAGIGMNLPFTETFGVDMDMLGIDFPIKRTLPDGTVEKVPFGLSEEPGSFPLSMGLFAEVGISPHFWWVMDHVQFYARASQTIFFSPLDDKYSDTVGISRKLRTVSYEFGIRIPFWFIRD